MPISDTNRIPEEELGELWYAFNHNILEQLQNRARELEAAGQTQKLIAERLGRDPASVNRWLRGRSNMTVRTMHDLARAMSCRLQVALQPLESLQKANSNTNPWSLPQPAHKQSESPLASMARVRQVDDSLETQQPQSKILAPMGARTDFVIQNPSWAQRIGVLEQDIPKSKNT